MKAVVMSKPGTASVLLLQEVERPQLTLANQVLIKLKAAGINPIDTKLRQRGTFYPEDMPAILGLDGAGVIVAVGPKVTKFKVSDEVYYCAGGLGRKNTGNYAEYALVEEHRLARKPTSVNFTQAAAFPLALITAWEALYDRLRLTESSKVLIHAGTGGVGHLAIQLAKLRGAQVATTVSSPDKARLARKLGADLPILYGQNDFVQSVLDWTDGEGVDLVFDTVGGDVFFNSLSAVKVYGDIVTILEPDFKLGNLKLARNRNLRISLELMLSPELLNLENYQAHQAHILEQAALLIDQGKLNVHLSEIYPLESAAKAHEVLEKGSTTGKIVLLID